MFRVEVNIQTGERVEIPFTAEETAQHEALINQPIPVPQSVTALQGLLALDAAGMSSVYEAWAAAPERTFAQKAFISKAQTWRRSDPTLSAAAIDFGLSAGQLDDLFTLAATL